MATRRLPDSAASAAGESVAARRPQDLVELGFVRGAYGLKGWAHIDPFDVDAPVLRAARHWWLVGRSGSAPVEVVAVRRHGRGLVARWAGSDGPAAVDGVKGSTVCVARSEFPPAGRDQYYWVDLVGCEVLNRQDQRLGVVGGVRSNGVHDLIEVAADDGRARLIPLVADYVDAVDLAARRIEVDWMPDW